MIEKLIPKYPTFLIVGLVIVASGLFLLTAGRDAVIAVWVTKFFDGETDQGLFKASQIADRALGHTLTVWFFLGLSFIKLGIGFAIATIVQNLRATGRATLSAYSSAGVRGAPDRLPAEPWYGRWFTKFLFTGILVMGFFFVLMLWWDINAVRLVDAELDGHTSGAAYNTYLMVDRVLGTIIGSGKFLGESLLIFGILTGLATIIWNLSFQARALPTLTRRALQIGDADGEDGLPSPYVPDTLLKLGIAGLVVMVIATPLALVHSGIIGWELGRMFEGATSQTALRLDGAFQRIIDPLTFMGLGVLFFTIALLLLNIIRSLRTFRQDFGDVVADLSGGTVSQPVVELPLWPTRLVPPLAIFGILVIGFFSFTMTGVRELNYNHLLNLQFAGMTDTAVFQNALRLDRMLGPVIGATRFIGAISIMLAIGLALVTIVINLRATAMLLPAGFSKLITVAKGKKAEEEDLTVYNPMALAPWDLFRPILLGGAVAISATLPIIILLSIFTHQRMEQVFLGLGGPESFSDRFETAFWATNLIGASWQPWMLFGMGIILFAIGRFFNTIVGFVQARRMIIAEGTEAIAEAVAARNMEKVSA